MRIVVCVKQVYDPATVRVSRSREELDLRGATKTTNPADRYALEAGLRLAEAAEPAGEVIALTVGDAAAEDVAHEAVAMGATRAVLVTGPEVAAASGGAITRAIVAAIKRFGTVDVVITGQVGALDGGGGLPARLAAALDWPVVLDATQLQPAAEGGLDVLAALDEGGCSVPVPLPAVVAVMPGPQRPRYPHAARIANAWAPGLVEICTAADLGLPTDEWVAETEPGMLVLGPERIRGQVVGGTPAEAAASLLETLRSRRLMMKGATNEHGPF
jgi:electron transfer flavoprotein beta subunit